MPHRNTQHSHKITIVGAGLSGPLLAVFLARRGCEVDVYERHGDPRVEQVSGGRSINLTIAARGLDALRRVGLKEEVQETLCKRLRYRVVHDRSGDVTRIPYGVGSEDVLYSVSRTELTKFMLDVAEEEPRVRLHFHHRCEEVDKRTATAKFTATRTGASVSVDGDVVVGADGVHSIVRRNMQRGEIVDFEQHYVPWRYKELTIDPGAQGGDGEMVADGLHVWPRGDFMMFALPSRDGGFNGVCVLPAEGDISFDELGSQREVRAFFEANFADVVPLMPSLEQECVSRPAGGFPTIRTSSWHHRDRVVLIGDACHGVIPFYGQGMNAAFEDCVVFDECLAEHWRNWDAAFEHYERRRRVNTDVLADLSIANFSELRDTVSRPSMTARKRVFQVAHRVLGPRAAPLYTLVSHTTTPYAECVQIAARRERMARLLGADVAVAALVAAGTLRRAVGRRPRSAAAAAELLAGAEAAAGMPEVEGLLAGAEAAAGMPEVEGLLAGAEMAAGTPEVEGPLAGAEAAAGMPEVEGLLAEIIDGDLAPTETAAIPPEALVPAPQPTRPGRLPKPFVAAA